MPRRRSLETDSEEEERPARNAANARERARMRVLSRAFSRLKTTLPWVPPDTKLSKLDTLRLATSYIAHLRRVLGAGQPQPSLPHPVSFSWPFTFHGSPTTDCQQEQEPQQLYNPNPYPVDTLVQIG
nr:transcription factor 21-like [Halyomorpha halys]